MEATNISKDITFKELVNLWFNDKKKENSDSSKKRILQIMGTINSFIGDMKVKDIKLEDIKKYVSHLDSKTRTIGYCIAKKNIRRTLHKYHYISNNHIKKEINAHTSTIGLALAGHRTCINWCKRFAKKLKIPYSELFDEYSEEVKYATSDKQKNISIIRNVLGYGCEIGIINENVADLDHLGKLSWKKPKKYSPATKEDLNNLFLYVLDHNNRKLALSIVLLMVAKFQRKKIAGLKWEDIDFENNIINIKREVSISNIKIIERDYTESIKIDERILILLEDYQNYLNHKNVKSEYVFPRENGEMTHPTTHKTFLRRSLMGIGKPELGIINFKIANLSIDDVSAELFDYIKPKGITEKKEKKVISKNKSCNRKLSSNFTEVNNEMKKYGFKTYQEYFDFINFLEAVEKSNQKKEARGEMI